MTKSPKTQWLKSTRVDVSWFLGLTGPLSCWYTLGSPLGPASTSLPPLSGAAPAVPWGPAVLCHVSVISGKLD